MTEYFTITRTLAAPRDVVFEVLTRPEHFSVWFGTSHVEVPQDTLTMDVRPGGDFRAVMHLPDGNQINWSGGYDVVEPPAQLSMRLSDQPGDQSGLPVIFDLDEVPGGTQLTIRQDRSTFSDEQVAATIAGYNAFIDDMTAVVAAITE